LGKNSYAARQSVKVESTLVEQIKESYKKFFNTCQI